MENLAGVSTTDTARAGVTDEETAGFCTSGLAELPGEALLDEKALANLLGISRRTVRRMVYLGQVPAGIKLGGRRVWVVSKLLEYLTEEAERMADVARATAARFRVVE